ncbi:phage minor head protein [Geobacillus stearothermophilus]|uniref:phage head morphogenesis protein n=1 Tax=Geobacillus stearothermophilus TaxID=1422 RepID=UPI003D19DD9A
MCEVCKLLDMDRELVAFLVAHGALPAIKEQDERITEIEEKLARRLVSLQVGLESMFIQRLRELGYIPLSILEQETFIADILDPIFADMEEEIAEAAVESAVVARQLTFEEILEQGLELVFTEFSERVLEELRERVYVFSEDTFRRIKGDFRATLVRGYEEGKGIDDIAVDLRADFKDLRDHRLQTIARTEVQGAQNVGIFQTMQDYNVRYKQWLTVRDSRVRGRNPKDRADHYSLHGQVVRMDERFSNGLMHPLDRSGPIEEWINCRCRCRPYIPKKGEAITRTPYYP